MGPHFEKTPKLCFKWENEHKIFFLLQNHYFYWKAYKEASKKHSYKN